MNLKDIKNLFSPSSFNNSNIIIDIIDVLKIQIWENDAGYQNIITNYLYENSIKVLSYYILDVINIISRDGFNKNELLYNREFPITIKNIKDIK